MSGDKDKIFLNARIISGRGIASQKELLNSNELKLLNIDKLVPGTINLILNKPIEMPLKGMDLIKKTRGKFFRNKSYFWKGYINNIPVVFIRWQGCPSHILEAISEFHLRSKGYSPGREVTVSFEKQIFKDLKNLNKICWRLLWGGREDLWYSSNFYWLLARLIILTFRKVKEFICKFKI